MMTFAHTFASKIAERRFGGRDAVDLFAVYFALSFYDFAASTKKRSNKKNQFFKYLYQYIVKLGIDPKRCQSFLHEFIRIANTIADSFGGIDQMAADAFRRNREAREAEAREAESR